LAGKNVFKITYFVSSVTSEALIQYSLLIYLSVRHGLLHGNGRHRHTTFRSTMATNVSLSRTVFGSEFQMAGAVQRLLSCCKEKVVVVVLVVVVHCV